MANGEQHRELAVRNILIRQINIPFPAPGREIIYFTHDFFVEKIISLYVISGLIFCNSIKPGSGILRNSLKAPGLKRRYKGLTGNVFSGFNLFEAKKPAENSRYPAVFSSEEMWD